MKTVLVAEMNGFEYRKALIERYKYTDIMVSLRNK